MEANNLTIKDEEKGKDGVSIFLDGEMTLYNTEIIRQTLMEKFNNYSKLEIDASQVNKIDTAGFQLMLAARREAGRRDKEFSVINTSNEVNKILNLYEESLK